jgi:hypothetical protein
MGWSMAVESSQSFNQSTNSSTVAASIRIYWSGGSAYANYDQEGYITIDGVGSGAIALPRELNYNPRTGGAASNSGSQIVASWSRAFTHDGNGYRGAKATSASVDGDYGFGLPDMSANGPTQPELNFNRSPQKPQTGTAIANLVTGSTIRVTSGVASDNSSGGPISDYEYQWRRSDDKGVNYTSWSNFASIGTDRIFDLSGVTPTSRYQFITRAMCGTDAGTSSDIFTKNGWPKITTNLVATTDFSSSGRINLAWTAADSDGAVTGYNIYRKLSTDALFPASPTYVTTGAGTTYTATTGLTLGATYNFRVSARNASVDTDIATLGSTVTAEQSNIATAISGGPTLAPTIGASVRSATTSGVIRVNWTKPDEAPGQIQQYLVYNASNNALVATLTATPPTDPPNFVDITGLNVGQSYSFYVKSVNAFGQSPQSANSVAVFAPGITAAPTSVTATPSTTVSERIRVQWAAPSQNPGTVTSYKVYRVDTNQLVATVNGNTQLYADISSTAAGAANNLTQGTSYQFYVTATNAYGTSLNSANSNSAMAPGTPTQPGAELTLTRVSAALKDIKVDCDPSSTDYGMNITNYYIQYATSTDNGNTFSSWSNEAIMTNRSTTYIDIVGGLTYKFRCYSKNSIIYEADGTTLVARQYTEATTYVPAIFKRYTGNAFQSGATMKRYNGTNWVQLTIAKKYDPANVNADIDGWVNLS